MTALLSKVLHANNMHDNITFITTTFNPWINPQIQAHIWLSGLVPMRQCKFGTDPIAARSLLWAHDNLMIIRIIIIIDLGDRPRARRSALSVIWPTISISIRGPSGMTDSSSARVSAICTIKGIDNCSFSSTMHILSNIQNGE